eukprot:gb/GECH01012239.1/.p1 GENE.gb/GECH01012239.1/~~gb/GECH01012239.1/.p1  ORF type:complete len:184 (+),score=41.76 gb/GECH01012239.1/:1-552(+)
MKIFSYWVVLQIIFVVLCLTVEAKNENSDLNQLETQESTSDSVNLLSHKEAYDLLNIVDSKLATQGISDNQVECKVSDPRIDEEENFDEKNVEVLSSIRSMITGSSFLLLNEECAQSENQCHEGLKCDSKSGLCKRELGRACSGDDCESPCECHDGFCLLLKGQSCSENLECISGNCVHNQCS